MTSWMAGDLMDAVMTPCNTSDPMQSPGPLFTNSLTEESKASERSVMEALTDLDRLIERRASSDPDPDTMEASYMESVRRHREKERREHLWQRLRFHERMLANHTRTFQEILERHQAGRERCEAMLGIGEGVR